MASSMASRSVASPVLRLAAASPSGFVPQVVQPFAPLAIAKANIAASRRAVPLMAPSGAAAERRSIDLLVRVGEPTRASRGLDAIEAGSRAPAAS